MTKTLRQYLEEKLYDGHSPTTLTEWCRWHGHDGDKVRATLIEIERDHFFGQVCFIGLLLAVLFGIALMPISEDGPTALIIQPVGAGCCEDLCTQGSASSCDGTFHSGVLCQDVPSCSLGCCVDNEGYCLDSYLQNTCTRRGGTFHQNRCTDVLFCVYESDKPTLIEKDQVAPVLSMPYATQGSVIPLYYYVGDKNVERVVGFMTHNEQVLRVLELHDDGLHQDGNSNDGVWGAVYSTAGLASPLDFHFQLHYRDGRTEKRESQFTLALEKDFCTPLTGYGDTSLYFTARGYNGPNGLLDYHNDVDALLTDLRFLGVGVQDMSFFRLDKPLQASASAHLTQECSSYNPTDLVFIFDESVGGCVQQGNTVTLSPSFFFKQTVRGVDSQTLFGDFCAHIVSASSVFDDIHFVYFPPTVTLGVSNGTRIPSSTFQLPFSIQSKSYPLNVSVLIDGEEFFTPPLTGDGSLSVPISGVGLGNHTIFAVTRNAQGTRHIHGPYTIEVYS